VTLAEEVKAVRLGLGLTWAAFAAELGVTWRAVAYWEAGTRRPGKPALILIRKLAKEHS